MANGYILFEGKSKLNGKNIVVVATGVNGVSKNAKTGGMIQVYILGTEMEPHLAVKDGSDDTICGNCVHRGNPAEGRGRSCYVQIGQGPLAVYRAWKRGNYPVLNDFTIFKGRKVRFGAYGDPAAVPAQVWINIANQTKDITGYTHQWKDCDPIYSNWCMASADSIEEAQEAQSKGYRTFRVALPQESLGRVKGEALCPASEEAGKKLQCHECLACGGNVKGMKGNIMINIHGNSAHLSNAKKIKLELVS